MNKKKETDPIFSPAGDLETVVPRDVQVKAVATVLSHVTDPDEQHDILQMLFAPTDGYRPCAKCGARFKDHRRGARCNDCVRVARLEREMDGDR